MRPLTTVIVWPVPKETDPVNPAVNHCVWPADPPLTIGAPTGPYPPPVFPIHPYKNICIGCEPALGAPNAIKSAMMFVWEMSEPFDMRTTPDVPCNVVEVKCIVAPPEPTSPAIICTSPGIPKALVALPPCTTVSPPEPFSDVPPCNCSVPPTPPKLPPPINQSNPPFAVPAPWVSPAVMMMVFPGVMLSNAWSVIRHAVIAVPPPPPEPSKNAAPGVPVGFGRLVPTIKYALACSDCPGPVNCKYPELNVGL